MEVQVRSLFCVCVCVFLLMAFHSAVDHFTLTAEATEAPGMESGNAGGGTGGAGAMEPSGGVCGCGGGG